MKTRDSLPRSTGRDSPGSLGFCLAFILAAALLAGCARDRPDLILVTLDTTRADRFSYVGGPVDTPAIDAVVARGAAFLQAVAPTPVTLPSHTSLLTGQRPTTHGVRDNGAYFLRPEATTLAELLRSKGYRTGAFVASAVLHPRYGLAQGFAEYPDPGERRLGLEVVNDALDWLKGGRSPAFAWIHLYDAHKPYHAPEPERSRYPGSRYDASVAYEDRVMGHLFSALPGSRATEGTLIVLTADHGESLGAHGERTHGVFVYEPTVRIPLVMQGPGIPEGVRIDTSVELMDVAPTILELLGLEVPNTMEGRSLLPLLRNQEWNGDPIYLESLLPRVQFGWRAVRGLREDPWKLITYGPEERELFHLRRDPEERKNLASSESDRATRMARELRKLTADEAESSRGRVTSEERRQLEALGYLGVGRTESSSGGLEDLPDPREKIEILELTGQANQYLEQGAFVAALATLEKARKRDERDPRVWAKIAEAHVKAGQDRQAADAATRALTLGWNDPQVLHLLAGIRTRQGRFGAALELYEAILEIEPDRREIQVSRWALLERVGQSDLVVREAREAVRDNPDHLAARIVLITTGQPAREDRIRDLTDLHERHPGSGLVASSLVRELLASDRQSQALSVLKETLAADDLVQADQLASVATMVGRTLLEAGRVGQAAEILDSLPGELLEDEGLTLLAKARWREGAVAEGLRACTSKISRGRSLDCWSRARDIVREGNDPSHGLQELGSLAMASGRFDLAAWAFRSAGALDDDPELDLEAWLAVARGSGITALRKELVDSGASGATAGPAARLVRLLRGEAVDPARFETALEAVLAAEIAFQRDGPGRAEYLLRNAPDPDPDLVVTARARLLLRHGRVEEARDLLVGSAEGAASAEVGIRRSLLLAQAFARTGDPGRAVLILEDAVQDEPWNDLAWSSLGAAQLQSRNFVQATVSLVRANRLGSRDPTVEANLELARRMAGD